MSAKVMMAEMRVVGHPQTVIMRFVARRTLKSATFLALAFAVVVASKVVGYVQVYPTAKDQVAAAAALANNAGVKVLYGTPHHLETVAGFAVWYALTMGVLLGSVWAWLVATRQLRGEETAGRWELLLAGQTTRRRAAAGALGGLAVSLMVFYAIAAITLTAIGSIHQVNYAPGPALFFALAAVSAAVMFMAIGALASQLMPTRARAAGLAAAVFGVSFAVRAAGDVTNAHWLLNVTPLGWVEQLQPLVNPQPIWLLPIVGLSAVAGMGAVWLAGKRDLGASVVRDHDTARPRLRLLSGPLLAAVRTTRGVMLAWIGALGLSGWFFGALASTAVQVFQSSSSAQQYLDRLSGAGSATASTKAFIGAIFFIFMLVLMAYAASSAGAMRADEAQGYLDNLLVRKVSRRRWLWGRVGLAMAVAVGLAATASVSMWLGVSAHPNGLMFGDLIKAGLNMVPAAIFTLGIGIFSLGMVPRLTTVIAYGVIAWSFLIELVGSGTTVNHWVLDTSVFTHVAFAPAVEPKWRAGAVLVMLGLALVAIGALRFNRRDLASE